jgi:hypothetical protein
VKTSLHTVSRWDLSNMQSLRHGFECDVALICGALKHFKCILQGSARMPAVGRKREADDDHSIA